MRARQKVTRAGIQLIAAFEGLRRRAARLPDGRWTIGYGHTLSAREGAEVSEEDAQALLHFDLLPFAEAVNSLVYSPLTQNQFDALCAFAYNVGVDQFRASDVLKRVNEGRLTEAACALDLWRKADLSGEPVILDALIRRRAAEKALFLTPHDGFVPTPSPLVRPRVDTDLAPALPQSRPVDVDVPMEGAVAEIVRVSPAIEISDEPVEITQSDAEPAETLPRESEPVQPHYSDDVVIEASPLESVQAFEAGAEAIGAVADQPIDPRLSEQPVVEVIPHEPEPVADIPVHPIEPIEGEAVEVFPYAPEPQALEPAVELVPESPFPVEPVVVASPELEVAPEQQTFEATPEPQPEAAPEPGVEAQPEPQAQPEASIPLAVTPPERIYAPDAVEPEAQPEPQPEAYIAPVEFQPEPHGPVEPAPEPAVEPMVETIAPPEPAPFEPPSGWSLTPPPEVIEQPPSRQDTAPPRANAGDEDQVALFDPDSMDQDVAGRVIRYEELEETDDDTAADRSSTGIFVLMGAIGLTAIGGAMAAYIKGSAGTDSTTQLTVLAWILAFIGAGCVGTSVYFVLKRLGGVDD